MKQKRNKWDSKAKQRKQRRLAIILGVILASVAGWQGPKTWKSLNAKPALDAAPAAVTTPVGLGVGGPVATATPGSSLASAPSALPPATDPIPVAGEGQLVGFSLFKSKDPFAAQLSDEPTTTEPAAEPPASSPPAAEPPASEPPASSPPAAAPPAIVPPASEPPAVEPPAAEPPATEPPATEPPVTVPPTTEPPATSPPPPVEPPATSPPAPPVTPPAPPPAKPTSALISVNGVKEEISFGGVFPKDEQLFRLVSIEDDVAQIAIAGGSYQDGAPTVPLTLGKPLTLMNTADGTRYVLRLLSVS